MDNIPFSKIYYLVIKLGISNFRMEPDYLDKFCLFENTWTLQIIMQIFSNIICSYLVMTWTENSNRPQK